MPKVRRSRKRPPDGWELIEPTLEELEQKMREGLCVDLTTETHYLCFTLSQIRRFCFKFQLKPNHTKANV